MPPHDRSAQHPLAIPSICTQAITLLARSPTVAHSSRPAAAASPRSPTPTIPARPSLPHPFSAPLSHPSSPLSPISCPPSPFLLPSLAPLSPLCHPSSSPLPQPVPSSLSHHSPSLGILSPPSGFPSRRPSPACSKVLPTTRRRSPSPRISAHSSRPRSTLRFVACHA